MRKSKIIVASMMLFCVICFAVIAVYFLLLQNNNAEPANEQRIAAIIQVAGLAKAGETDARALQTLFHRRVIARQVDLDSGTLMSSASSQDTPTSYGHPAGGPGSGANSPSLQDRGGLLLS